MSTSILTAQLPGASVELLPGVARSIVAHRQAGQQPDNLCGPYWVSLLLQTLGTISIRADELALLAGSILPAIEDSTSSVPPGANPRLDYQVPLPHTADASLSGTAVAGLIAATHQASVGQYRLVPLSTSWTAERVETVLNLCQDHPDWMAVPLCNVQTGHFWGSQLGVVEAIAYLNGELIQPPVADWDVGHFVVLAGQIKGTAQSLLIIQDTYAVLGWDGYHLQPAAAVAQSLSRSDGSQGGVAIFVAESNRVAVEQSFQAEGLAIEIWDNGTPWSNFFDCSERL